MNLTSTTHTLDFEVDSMPRLTLRNHRGDITVRTDGAPGQVRLELTSNHPVDFTPIETATTGDQVTVTIPPLSNPDGGPGFTFSVGSFSFSTGSHGVNVDVEIHVPAGATLDLQTGAGDVTVDPGPGRTRASTGAGDVTLVDVDEADLHSGAGDVRVARLGGGKVRTGSGDVSLDSVTGRCEVNTGMGDIHVGESAGDLTVATGAGDVRAYVASGSVALRTGAGDINVQVPTGVPVWRDISTGIGDASSRIDPVGAPEDGAPHISVTARSGAGDVSLTH